MKEKTGFYYLAPDEMTFTEREPPASSEPPTTQHLIKFEDAALSKSVKTLIEK